MKTLFLVLPLLLATASARPQYLAQPAQRTFAVVQQPSVTTATTSQQQTRFGTATHTAHSKSVENEHSAVHRFDSRVSNPQTFIRSQTTPFFVSHAAEPAVTVVRSNNAFDAVHATHTVAQPATTVVRSNNLVSHSFAAPAVVRNNVFSHAVSSAPTATVVRTTNGESQQQQIFQTADGRFFAFNNDNAAAEEEDNDNNNAQTFFQTADGRLFAIANSGANEMTAEEEEEEVEEVDDAIVVAERARSNAERIAEEEAEEEEEEEEEAANTRNNNNNNNAQVFITAPFTSNNARFAQVLNTPTLRTVAFPQQQQVVRTVSAQPAVSHVSHAVAQPQFVTRTVAQPAVSHVSHSVAQPQFVRTVAQPAVTHVSHAASPQTFRTVNTGAFTLADPSNSNQFFILN